MRTDITLDDLDGFLALPVVAVLATHRPDGTVLLSPVWHRWRDGGFEIWVGVEDVKVRHLRRDPRATVLVAETDLPYRGVEVRGEAEFIDRDVAESAVEIASRYVGDERGTAFVGSNAVDDLIVRVAPGEIRVWDFADDFPVA
jgi:PPOX class probable F420-dependent enzyme